MGDVGVGVGEWEVVFVGVWGLLRGLWGVRQGSRRDCAGVPLPRVAPTCCALVALLLPAPHCPVLTIIVPPLPQVSEHAAWSSAYYRRIVDAALAAAGAPADLVQVCVCGWRWRWMVPEWVVEWHPWAVHVRSSLPPPSHPPPPLTDECCCRS